MIWQFGSILIDNLKGITFIPFNKKNKYENSLLTLH